MKNIAVIGGGISGLSCAFELQQMGFKVTLFEKNGYPGGRMSTRIKEGFSFDIGADFFVKLYKHTHKYCQLLNVDWQAEAPGHHYTYRKQKLHLLSLNGIRSWWKFTSISLLARLRLLLLFLSVKNKKNLDFFDLSSAASELDSTNAYEYTKKIAGQEVADIIIDGFTSAYQFHSSKEISLTGTLALLSLMVNQPAGFALFYTPPSIQTLPNALASRLNICYSSSIISIYKKSEQYSLTNSQGKKYDNFDALVLVTTADVAAALLKNLNPKQQEFLKKVRYSSTISVSFQVNADCLKDIAIVSVPVSVSPHISSYSNQAMKNIRIKNQTLINVWLHEDYAKQIMDKTDQEIFSAVKKELMIVCPNLGSQEELIKPHDLQRWPQAMPKFSPGYVSTVREFLQNGQGENNIWLCGDYLNSPWVEGSIRCGKKVAREIQRKFL